jgi:hypothetical protein
MAQLRLVLALLASGAAPALADAPPESGVTPPASWKALPRVAAALADGARGEGVTIEATAAWGDPGRGCFAVWLAARGGGGGPVTADAIVASLGGAHVTTRDVAPSADAVTLGFERGPFRGRLRATLAGDAVRALACFGDGREPAACEAACAQVVPK